MDTSSILPGARLARREEPRPPGINDGHIHLLVERLHFVCDVVDSAIF